MLGSFRAVSVLESAGENTRPEPGDISLAGRTGGQFRLAAVNLMASDDASTPAQESFLPYRPRRCARHRRARVIALAGAQGAYRH